MTVTELLKELIEHTNIVTNTISFEAKDILTRMRDEFKRIDESNDPQKQEKMITLFIGGIIAALTRDDSQYKYPIKLYPRNTVAILVAKYPEKTFYYESVEFYYALGKEALSNLPHSFCGDLFKLQTLLINRNNLTPFFPQLCMKADKVDKVVKFCLDHKDNLESSDPVSDESVYYDFPPNFVDEFVENHKKSIQSGFFGGFFNRTNLKPYNTLTPQDILEHAKKTTFLGLKNRTCKILEEMEVTNSAGDLIKESVKFSY